MAKNLTLTMRGAILRHFDGTDAEEEKFFVRAHMSCDATAELMEAFSFDDMPESSPGPLPLRGEVTGSHIVLTPNGGVAKLDKHELHLNFDDMADFKLHRTTIKNGKATGLEIRFVMRTRENGAAGKMEAYKRAIGRGNGAMKVVYTNFNQEPATVGADAGQMNIGDAQGTAADAVAASKAN